MARGWVNVVHMRVPLLSSIVRFGSSLHLARSFANAGRSLVSYPGLLGSPLSCCFLVVHAFIFLQDGNSCILDSGRLWDFGECTGDSPTYVFKLFCSDSLLRFLQIPFSGSFRFPSPVLLASSILLYNHYTKKSLLAFGLL